MSFQQGIQQAFRNDKSKALPAEHLAKHSELQAQHSNRAFSKSLKNAKSIALYLALSLPAGNKAKHSEMQSRMPCLNAVLEERSALFPNVLLNVCWNVMLQSICICIY